MSRYRVIRCPGVHPDNPHTLETKINELTRDEEWEFVQALRRNIYTDIIIKYVGPSRRQNVS